MVVSCTHNIRTKDLSSVDALKGEHPLNNEIIKKVQDELLLPYTHFSINHIKLIETRLLTVLATKPKRIDSVDRTNFKSTMISHYDTNLLLCPDY